MQNYKKILNWWQNNKMIIIVTIFWGLIVHFCLYSNILRSPDSLWNSGIYEASFWELSLGRWLPQIIDKLQFGTIFPFWSVFLTLCVYSVGNIFFINLFAIDNLMVKTIVSCLVISNPFIGMSLQYYYSNDTYALAYLLSVLSIYMIKNNKNQIQNYIYSIIFIVMSLALYQSFLGVVTTAALFCILQELFDDKKKIIDYRIIYTCFGKYIIVLFGGVGIYYVILKILLWSNGISLSSYKGADNVSVISVISRFPERIFQCYRDFFEYYFGTEISRNAYLINLIQLVTIIMLVFIITKRVISIGKYKGTLVIILLLIVPIACNIINVFATETKIYLLTIGGMLVFIPGMVLLNFVYLKQIGHNTIYILCVITIYLFVLQNNANYMSILGATKQASSLVNRIWMRVESLDIYKPDMKVMIVGNPNQNKIYSNVSDYTQYADWYARVGLFWSTWDGSTNCWTHLIKNELGIDIVSCSEKEYQSIISSVFFEDIPTYPNSKSIFIKDDILVVKIADVLSERK